MAKRYNIYLLLTLTLTIISCSRSLTRSGGSPYDVAIVANDEVSGRIVMREMSLCSEEYTSAEPMFQLSLSKEKSREDVIRLSRTLLIVDTADVRNTTVVRERDVWASPQLVIYVRTPSARQLSEDFPRMRNMIAREINNFELSIALKSISGSRNKLLEDSVKKRTGMVMYVPADMKIALAKNNFIWLTANQSDENKSLCIYSTHKDSVDINDIGNVTTFRNRMMRNIRGAIPDDNWTIVEGTERTERDTDTLMIRCRWEMTTDAMGGMSACRVITNGDSLFFAETFLYAPASKKRNKMRRLEAVLKSCKP